MKNKFLRCSFLLFTIHFSLQNIQAQEAYEIQVYGSETMPVKQTIFELHSNISPVGPLANTSFHPIHETLEITTGITNNFEIGAYFFTRFYNGKTNYIGSHIRPRIAAPENWGWKFGASFSAEIGFENDPEGGPRNWTLELRPIFDKTIGKHYLAINPTIEGSLSDGQFDFSPNIKYSFSVNKKISLGAEYYGAVGPVFRWDFINRQYHQLYGVLDLYLSENFEFNFGIGRGLTDVSDAWNLKLILGRKINWGRKK